MGKSVRLISMCIGVAACANTSETIKTDLAAPIYSASQIYKLSWHGVRLGMTAKEACTILIANGYSRRPTDFPGDHPCSPKHIVENAEIYFGMGWKGNAELDGKPARDVHSLTLEYLPQNGVLTVATIGVDTRESGTIEELQARGIAEWGPPTRKESWGFIAYAPDSRQAEFTNRSDFGSCLIWTGCSSISGKDCHHIVQKFAVPYAQQSKTYDGRSIKIADGRRALNEARRLGLLKKMLAKNVSYVCPVLRVH